MICRFFVPSSAHFDDFGEFCQRDGRNLQLDQRRRPRSSAQDRARVLDLSSVQARRQAEAYEHLFHAFAEAYYILSVTSKSKDKSGAVNMDELIGNTDGFADSG